MILYCDECQKPILPKTEFILHKLSDYPNPEPYLYFNYHKECHKLAWPTLPSRPEKE